MMNITLSNPLSGEIQSLNLPMKCSLSTLQNLLYREIYPEAALGTLELRRVVSDVENDEVAQLMVMGESLTDQDPHEVTTLFDGMELIVFINPFLLKPSVFRKYIVEYCITKKRSWWIRTMDVFTVSFHHPTKMITEESNVVTSVDLLHDIDENRWAFYSTVDVTEANSWERAQIKPTAETKWFSSPIRCLAHAQERIPKNEDTFEQIKCIFREGTWDDLTHEDEDEDDQDREEAEAWGRAVDAREQWYEEHIRWQ